MIHATGCRAGLLEGKRLKLYGYELSQATMRVRIALNLKGIAFQERSLDLLAGDQFDPGFLAVNPQAVVPALIAGDGGSPLFQSMAILEYIEETWPEPPLLPGDARGRARVRGLSQIIVADTHRVQVPRVRRYLTETLAQDQEALGGWIRYRVGAGLAAFEAQLAGSTDTGPYCHGARVTFADLCLVPQIFGARRFDVPLDEYPLARAIFDRCLELDAFREAAPPGTPRRS